MSRYDLYAPIHKGLRFEMGRLQSRLGAFDPASAPDRAAILSELKSYLELAEIHLFDEDKVIHPQLEARAPGSTRVIADDHDHHRAAFAELRALIDTAARADSASRCSRFHSLYLAFSRFVADDLAHLHREETEILPLLQRLFSDAELRAMEQEIVATVPPAKLMMFIRLMLPAMNHSERYIFLNDARTHAPSELYEGIVEQGAKPSLMPQDWSRLENALQDA